MMFAQMQKFGSARMINIFKIKLNTNMKMVAIIGLINFIASIAICAMTYMFIYNVSIEDFGTESYNAASAVAGLLDEKKIIKYRDTMTMDDEYETIIRGLDNLKKSLDLKYLYVESWDGKGQRFMVYDATEPGDGIQDSAYNRELLGYPRGFEDYANQIISNYDNPDKYKVVNTSYGHTVCSYYPIKDAEGNNVALVGVDISISELFRKINKFFRVALLLIQALIIAVTVLLIFVLEKYFARPLKKISDTVKNFVSKDHNEINIKPVYVKNKDEIGILANSFNKMMVNVQKYAKHIEKISAEKEQVYAELNIATQIQRSLIPHIFPAFPELDEMDIYAIMKPARKVGGDFYDFFLLDNTHLAFVIADVSGKGISAALFMVIAKTLIKNEANSSDDPSIILEKVNKQMCVDNDLGMFITAFFGILDLETGEIRYVNAGHTTPIGKMKGEFFKELKVQKQFVVAGMPNLKFKTDKIKLEKDDILFLYTDGISEAQNSENKCWGKENLILSLNNIDTSRTNLEHISKIICDKVYKFMGKGVQSDDITILIIKYYGQK